MKQCPSTLGTIGFGGKWQGGGPQRAPLHPWPEVFRSPGSEPSPSRIVCCSQPETESPQRLSLGRLMEETRAVRFPRQARRGVAPVSAWQERKAGQMEMARVSCGPGNHKYLAFRMTEPDSRSMDSCLSPLAWHRRDLKQ